MKIPSIKTAHDTWGMTKIEVSQHDQIIDSMRVILQQKYMLIVRDIKHNGSIVGLSQYDLSNDEIYAMHMMLIVNENIVLQEEHGYAKYIYTNSAAKEGLGMRAFGLYWLSDDLIKHLYKKYKMNNPKMFRSVCFILNTLMGYAYQHKASVSNENTFNINNLARSLFMSMDQFLLALTILRMHGIVKFQRVDHNFTFKFMFCDMIANDIETQLSIAKTKEITSDEDLYNFNENTEQQIDNVKINNEQDNQYSICDNDNNAEVLQQLNNDLSQNNKVINNTNTNTDINTEESNEKINNEENKTQLDNVVAETIEYLKQHATTTYISLPLTSVIDACDKALIKNKISHHPNVIFQPTNFDGVKKVQYIYQYIEDPQKKINNFSDYCIYRFINQRLVKALQIMWQKYNFKVDLIDILWTLDYLIRHGDTKLFNKFNSKLFKHMGIIVDDFTEYKCIIDVLTAFELIDVTSVHINSKRFLIHIRLFNVKEYMAMNYQELVELMDIKAQAYQAKLEEEKTKEQQLREQLEQVVAYNQDEIIPNKATQDEIIKDETAQNVITKNEIIKDGIVSDTITPQEIISQQSANKISSLTLMTEQDNTQSTLNTINNTSNDTFTEVMPTVMNNVTVNVNTDQITSSQNSTATVNTSYNIYSEQIQKSLAGINVQQNFSNAEIISLIKENEKLLQNIILLTQEKEKLVVDNTNLLIQLTNLRNVKFTANNMEHVKIMISNCISVLLNYVLVELHNLSHNYNTTALFNSQKQIVKAITNAEQEILDSLTINN